MTLIATANIAIVGKGIHLATDLVRAAAWGALRVLIAGKGISTQASLTAAASLILPAAWRALACVVAHQILSAVAASAATAVLPLLSTRPALGINTSQKVLSGSVAGAVFTPAAWLPLPTTVLCSH